MAFDEVMGLTNRLLAQALGLSAIAARLRLDELGEQGDPALREQLDRVLDELGIREQLDELDRKRTCRGGSFARSYLAQGLDLVDDPTRPSAWSHSDPVLLQAQGSASAVVATLLRSSVSRSRVAASSTSERASRARDGFLQARPRRDGRRHRPVGPRARARA